MQSSRPSLRPTGGDSFYRFRYLWSETVQVGVMAQDLLNGPVRRGAVILQPDGYYAVDYASLGLRMASFAEWQASGPASVQLNATQPPAGPMPVTHTRGAVFAAH